jgi:hypothetical protein
MTCVCNAVPASTEGGVKYPCAACGKSYSWVNDLRRHRCELVAGEAVSERMLVTQELTCPEIETALGRAVRDMVRNGRVCAARCCQCTAVSV